MTEQEFKERLNKLQNEFDKNKKSLGIEYAKENQKFNLGDILQDATTIIKVDKITYSYMFGMGGMLVSVYNGVQLRKNLTSAKRQDCTAIYQSEKVVKIN